MGDKKIDEERKVVELKHNMQHVCDEVSKGVVVGVRRLRVACMNLGDIYESISKCVCVFFFSSRRRHTRSGCDWVRRVLFRSLHYQPKLQLYVYLIYLFFLVCCKLI